MGKMKYDRLKQRDGTIEYGSGLELGAIRSLKLYFVLVAKVGNTSISITTLSPTPSHGEHQNDVIRDPSLGASTSSNFSPDTSKGEIPTSSGNGWF